MRRLIMLLSATITAAAIVMIGFWLRPRRSFDLLPGPERTRLAAIVAAATAPPPLGTGRAVVALDPSLTAVPHTVFPLIGGHAEISCTACHRDGLQAPSDCIDCHAADDPHAGAFGEHCATCHQATGWLPATFSHDRIGDQDCVACHAPPPNHYEGTCRSCHIDTTNFLIVQFDHSGIGAQDCVACHAPPPNHYDGTCSSCHIDTTNFRNVQFDHSGIGAQDCVACHAAPPDHFPGACRDCHQDTTNFRNALFDHSFPLDHGDANSDCLACHPGNVTTSYSCYSCHDEREMVREHAEEGIRDLANCVRCHPNGEESDEESGGESEDRGARPNAAPLWAGAPVTAAALLMVTVGLDARPTAPSRQLQNRRRL